MWWNRGHILAALPPSAKCFWRKANSTVRLTALPEQQTARDAIGIKLR